MGGNVKPLVRTARSGRPIIALDGCPLHCAAQILKRHDLTADRHYDLSKLAVEKRKHEDFDPHDAARVLQHILEDPELPMHRSVTNSEPMECASPQADLSESTASDASPKSRS